MITLRRSLAIISITLLLSFLLAACGGTQTAATPPTTPVSQSTMMPQSTMTPQTTPTMTGGTQQALIHTATVTINGKKVQVLSNNKGFLLYYYTKDAKMTSKCTGACAQNWPPVLAPQDMMTVSSTKTLPHKLSVHKTANGNQVFYDGHALYTYVGDKKAGQFNGRGASMAWYLVSVTL